MWSRDDIRDTIHIDTVTNLLIFERAWAQLSLDHGTATGDVHIRRTSVTDGINFKYSTLVGQIHFEELESLGPLQLDYSTIDGTFHIDQSVFRQELTFSHATVVGVLHFSKCTFRKHAIFEYATVDAVFEISDTTFDAGVSLSHGYYHGPLKFCRLSAGDFDLTHATVADTCAFEDSVMTDGFRLDGGDYHGPVRFDGMTFAGRASFAGLRAHDVTVFKNTTFTGDVGFETGAYSGPTTFRDVIFERTASFAAAEFHDTLRFNHVTFKGLVTFEAGHFAGPVTFEDVIFDGPVFFDNASFSGGLVFERATFRDEVRFDLTAGLVTMKRVSLGGVSIINIQGNSDIRLNECAFGSPTTISGLGAGSRLVALKSVAGSDLKNLVIADIIVDHCLLSEGHNLDKLVIESPTSAFARSPSNRTLRRLRRWTPRRVLLEEVLCRTNAGAGSAGRDWQTLKSPGESRTVAPERAARAYRELRKGLEDAKDEPGAADLYYGEMEMRRLSASGAERWLLGAYWLTSGYGLRASRALGALLLLIAIATAFVAWAGFNPPPAPQGQIVEVGPGRVPAVRWIDATGQVSDRRPAATEDTFRSNLLPAFTYCAESATVVFRGVEQRTTTPLGRWCQILLRILGPVLLGLAALSLRGRVKR